MPMAIEELQVEIQSVEGAMDRAMWIDEYDALATHLGQLMARLHIMEDADHDSLFALAKEYHGN